MFSTALPLTLSLRRLFRGPLVGVLMVIACGPASAQDSEIPGAPHLLPQDTLAYVRLDNAEEFRGDLGNSSVGRMLADPQLKPFAADIYRTMTELFDAVSAQLGISLDELLAIPSGQVAVALMPGNLSDQVEGQVEQEAEQDDSEEAIRRRLQRMRRQQNSFAGLFLIEAGENIDDLQTLVDRLEQRLTQSGYVRRTSTVDDTTLVRLLPPRTGRPEIEYFQRSQCMVLGIGHDTAANALDHWLDRSEDPTLADKADFSSVMARCIGAEETRPQLTFFVDPYHVVERLIKRGGAAALVWPMVEELGIAKIRGIGGSSFSGGEVFEDIMHFHLLIDPPRDGFFGVLRPETGDTAPPNWVPADVTSYTSIHWDFPTAYENLGKVLEKFQGPEPLQRFIEQPVKKSVDVSVQEDILDQLTGRYVGLRWIEPPARLNSQVQIHALEVKDSLAVKQVIAKIRERRPNDLQVETSGSAVLYMAKRPRRGNLPEGFRQPEPGLVLLGDWVIFSDSKTFLERAVRAHGDALPRLLNVTEYELVSSELGGKLDGEDPFLVSFLRSSDYIRQMYELLKSPDTKRFLQAQGERNPMVAKLSALLQRNELPPFEKFEKYFAPSGTFAYDEPAGIHFGSFTLRAE